jgi:hypothetical protein
MKDAKEGRVTVAAHSLTKKNVIKINTNFTIGYKKYVSMVRHVRNRNVMYNFISFFNKNSEVP